jgi:hypothetical protein
MATNALVIAESWDRIYKAFETINFVSYDYDSIKQSLIDNLKFNYPENFNDYIESSQLILLIESFAYIAEQLAYRIDMAAHENFISTASRKQSILKLAKMLSYTPSRNLPLRGLVKLTSISCSETIKDSQGNSLTNREIKWNDPNNPLWKEQFEIVLNRILVNKIGTPSRSFQVEDSVLQRYELNNILEKESQFTAFKNGILSLKVAVDGEKLDFELVPADVNETGVLEREPNITENFSIVYSDDGYGASSDTTGWMMLLKQGVLHKIPHTFTNLIPNRNLSIDLAGVNDTDVWIQEVDSSENIIKTWSQVDTLLSNNLHFNDISETEKYEISSLENDKIKIIFGDGDFSKIPTGSFNIWCRTSAGSEKTLQKTSIVNQQLSFGYYSKLGVKESCTVKYSLVAAIDNGSSSEDIEHIRASAPAVYYSQNRMVNGQDYNSYLLSDPSILRLKSINRTFAGQPKHITWNDASGTYQNVKIFGNDLRAYYDFSSKVEVSTVSSRILIDKVIEPLLSTPGVQNLLYYIYRTANNPIKLSSAISRSKFIETTSVSIASTFIQEKTELQGALDRHWYGEPSEIVMLDINYQASSGLPKSPFAVVDSDTDKLIYDSGIKLVKKNLSGGYVPVNETVNNVSGIQDLVSRYKRFGIRFNPDRVFSSTLYINDYSSSTIVPTDSASSFVGNQLTAKSEIITIQVLDEKTGSFSVHGSVTGKMSEGVIGVPYDNGTYKFQIGFETTDVAKQVVAGDSFIIQLGLVASSISILNLYKKNLYGRFEIISEVDLDGVTIDDEFNQLSPIIIIERVDDLDGQFLYWNILSRDLKLIFQSATTKFFFDSSVQIQDQDTGLPVKDVIKILKSNLNKTRTFAIGFDQSYDVVDDVKYNNGETNVSALSVSPSGSYDIKDFEYGYPNNPYQFLTFIAPADYVYFTKDISTGKLTSIKKTPYVQSLSYVNNESGIYVRKQGREDLDFLWQHFTAFNRVIDPSPTNIIDMYVLTKGYYTDYLKYLNGTLAYPPQEPTTTQLKNTYSKALSVKMISDTVILHSAKIKTLFGSEAQPELKAAFRVIKNTASKLTADQIKIKIIEIINDYFKIENWDFGQSMHATELISVIHKNLPLDVSSVVIVPKFSTNYFGDLFVITAEKNEILKSSAKIDDVEIVQGYDKLILKQQ